MAWADFDTDLTEWEPATRAEHAAFYLLAALGCLPWVAAAGGLIWLIWIVTR